MTDIFIWRGKKTHPARMPSDGGNTGWSDESVSQGIPKIA